ncbi:MAG: YggS family pyridoxal phosphate-dependent enzyme [Chloroflexi bacterium]|nr:YggS family pyridoxal phosphate-dependent enzyme [Chloroflexota bacterium]
MDQVIKQRYISILKRIGRAAEGAGRDPGSVRLVVVTKGHPLETARAAVRAGARLLGENYAEEGAEKARAISGVAGLEWHMIGHVQSRKARLVCENFACVHSVDSHKLAERLNRHAGELSRVLPVLLEINVSGEESKFGFAGMNEAAWPELAESLKLLKEYTNLEVRGLMTMAPYDLHSEAARPVFRRLRRLSEALRERLPEFAWTELSMGMSGDFETAIQEGATLVRIGEAILGPRPGKPSR